ncbi:hypothetical protein ALQ00_100774 [Pseudomonas syringae pv. tomato]|uniref:Uncharacterized protein n=5 Tax=Pseudomonas syringae group TaxID=136849 RepID=A0A3M4RN88_9PSED|nr:Uncharacterized protein AC505_1875 [Pseudomonas syringae pv. maculicola]KPB90103.1 Uncharacterized protein AC506_5345 [Pseudomonas syringae pv. maculicola str. M6]KPC11975.1 Uncharacterized protein AC500_0786 [Pseudomonas amygdali pv. lachrymans]KPW51337.1 hypothetical protein ALO86_100655 [Pseudomonas syringae pv. berberidis]KPZ17422.1 hypothetical protein ALO40_100894 [Pseudomonas syringae pv. viburni]RMM05887.1 hypothetical protein ALQ85_100816 [Pseudomonas syringae]RMN53020.1 hypotheti
MAFVAFGGFVHLGSPLGAGESRRKDSTGQHGYALHRASPSVMPLSGSGRSPGS